MFAPIVVLVRRWLGVRIQVIKNQIRGKASLPQG